MNDEEFLTGFEACTLTRSEWTHEAHLRMAWLYLTRLPWELALERVRLGIQQLNATFRKDQPQLPDGYHDTITVAFVRLVVAQLRHNDTFDTFRSRNPELFDRTLTALRQYYSKERLSSDAARRNFIEPDVRKLPEFKTSPEANPQTEDRER
jgi:hypothetical protein